MATKKSKVPTQTNVTIVIMGTIDSVDQAVIDKATSAIEKVAHKHLVCEVDIHSAPIIPRPRLTPEQKEKVREIVQQEMQLPATKALGRAESLHDVASKAAASFFS